MKRGTNGGKIKRTGRGENYQTTHRSGKTRQLRGIRRAKQENSRKSGFQNKGNRKDHYNTEAKTELF